MGSGNLEFPGSWDPNFDIHDRKGFVESVWEGVLNFGYIWVAGNDAFPHYILNIHLAVWSR